MCHLTGLGTPGISIRSEVTGRQFLPAPPFMSLKDVSADDALEIISGIIKILNENNNPNSITRSKILITSNNNQHQNEE
jgi:hypothetical protein